MSVIERLVARREVSPSGCWLWTGAKTSGGYGQIRLTTGVPTSYTHRLAYEALVGPIQDGLVIDHLCRNRACFNPEHLEPVTNRENTRRGGKAIWSHCPRGHEFTDDNTYRRPRDGRRQCRACIKARSLSKRSSR